MLLSLSGHWLCWCRFFVPASCFSCLFGSECSTPRSRRLHMPYVMLMLRLLTLVLCCSVFQETLALLFSLLCFCFIFFCLFLVKTVGTRCARFHMSSFMLMLILLTFVLCCCVSQETLGVLLSLVQQLSSDLTTPDAPKKLDWIRDSCLAVDPADPVLRQHMRPVLGTVHQSLMAAANSPTSAPEVRAGTRLCIHVVNSMLSSL